MENVNLFPGSLDIICGRPHFHAYKIFFFAKRFFFKNPTILNNILSYRMEPCLPPPPFLYLVIGKHSDLNLTRECSNVLRWNVLWWPPAHFFYFPLSFIYFVLFEHPSVNPKCYISFKFQGIREECFNFYRASLNLRENAIFWCLLRTRIFLLLFTKIM